MWSDEHPKEAGLWWISVEPAGRNPRPWVVLPPVFALSIDDDGGVRQVLPDEEVGGWELKPDVLYTTSALPELPRAVKFAPAGSLVVSEIDDETLPSDPWANA